MSEELRRAAPEGPLVRVRLTFAYDGGPFRGFAYQSEEIPTVARDLRRALGKMFGDLPSLTVAGRTDAGVHAQTQVVHFDVPEAALRNYSTERIGKSLNKQLSPHVVVREVAVVDQTFDARHSCVGRSYRYSVLNTPFKDPFLAAYTWHVPHELDLAAMNEAAQAVLGEHDFTSFCRQPDREDFHMIRRVDSAEWLDLGDIKRFDISGKAFCHQMVRSLVGSLVSIGRRRRPVSAMAETLEAMDRRVAGSPAPPQGLCLWDVRY